MANVKLTDAVVESAECRPDKYLIWDSDLPGFIVTINPSGRRVYGVDYYPINGNRKRMSIGLHGIFTCESARKQAKQVLREVAKGADPLVVKRAQRKNQKPGASAQTSPVRPGRKPRNSHQLTAHIEELALQVFQRCVSEGHPLRDAVAAVYFTGVRHGMAMRPEER